MQIPYVSNASRKLGQYARVGTALGALGLVLLLTACKGDATPYPTASTQTPVSPATATSKQPLHQTTRIGIHTDAREIQPMEGRLITTFPSPDRISRPTYQVARNAPTGFDGRFNLAYFIRYPTDDNPQNDSCVLTLTNVGSGDLLFYDDDNCDGYINNGERVSGEIDAVPGLSTSHIAPLQVGKSVGERFRSLPMPYIPVSDFASYRIDPNKVNREYQDSLKELGVLETTP